MIGVTPRLSLGSRPWTTEEVQQLRELATARTSVHAIAKKLGRPAKAVWHRTKSEDITLPRSKSE
jgi:hypothetical protein